MKNFPYINDENQYISVEDILQAAKSNDSNNIHNKRVNNIILDNKKKILLNYKLMQLNYPIFEFRLVVLLVSIRLKFGNESISPTKT